MEDQKFPVLPRLIGLMCLALGLFGLVGDAYTFARPAMLAVAPVWVSAASLFVDLLFVAGGVGIVLKKKPLYLLAMGACVACSVHSAISYQLIQWEGLMAASSSGHPLPQQAIAAGMFVAKAMTIVMGVLLPLVVFAILGFCYRRISPGSWR